MTRRVLGLDQCSADCAELVGGKAVGLGSLLREGLRVPPGFAVTTHAYRDVAGGQAGLLAEVEAALAAADGVQAEQAASARARALFDALPVPPGLGGEIAAAYERLGTGGAVPVAVRSSATAEDTAEASFAGQQETYLWVRGAGQVARHVLRCWGSLFTPQAIAYRRRLGIPAAEVAMGVVVQVMVPAEAAGVMLTIDPLTGDRSQITIEASYGLGAAVVNGEVTPDRYAVDKVTLDVRARWIGPKLVAYHFDPEAGEVRLGEVPADARDRPCLADDEVVELARLGKRIERALGRTQDVEWAIGPSPSGPREVHLLQSRPETVWSNKPREPLAGSGSSVMDRMLTYLNQPVRLKQD